MIARRLALALAAAAILAASAGVLVVAVAFALYALMRPALGPAGAAAVVAAVAATAMAIVGLVIARVGKRRRVMTATRSGSLAERALAMVREKPVLAIGAALGAGFLAIRNPRYLGAAVRAFVEGRETPPAL